MSVFGEYVDIVKAFLAVDGVGLAVIVVQFAKIKTYKGEVVIQNVMQATKLLWNAKIPEVAVFRDGLALHGIDAQIPIGHIGGGFHNIPPHEEFITMYPRKTILELHDTDEEGLFVVLATFSQLVDGEKWWYSSCRCRRAVTIEDGMFYCSACSTAVLDVTPRFRLKVEVYDGDEVATFVLFDTDCQHILKKSCREIVLCSKGKSADEEYPDVMKSIIGKEVLFKVEKSSDHGMKYDDSYKVKKICDDLAIIELFKDKTKIQTPTKLLTDPFATISSSEDKESLFSEKSVGCSSETSAVAETSVSLDDLSPFEGASICSVAGNSENDGLSNFNPETDGLSIANSESDGRTLTRPARKRKLVNVKTEK
ncbi:uncharacterized protein LOC130711499 [Lotus japonicus]|uniref:uncharacterized protein LOC130711499 n=1 Tax=Lotus japonicus TaxID=34305 RepID=UPI00258D71D4|nr:uncharacterized protein LOC130711499 [Lotus japonicus]